jgi:serine/threonine protein kinase
VVLEQRYRLLHPVGHGRFGSVYLALDEETNVIRAAKILHRPFNMEPRFLQRFQREAEILRSLDSPHIVRVEAVGLQDQLNYIIMEYVQGVTLARIIERSGRLTLAEALRYAIDVARGLEAIHRGGVVHRDIKPANIIVDDAGRAKIADFGIARAVESPRLTNSDFVGTAYYASPEQSNSQGVDIRADIYSLGIVLYEMLTGRLAFDGDTPISVMLKHAYEAVPQLPADAEVPTDVARVLFRCLEKQPQARFQAPAELLDALAGLSAGATGPGAEREPPAAETRAGAWFETRAGETITIPDRAKIVTIGRVAPKSQVYPDIDISALDGGDSVSRRHARLVRSGAAWCVMEDQSRHGTMVNGVRVEPQLMIPLADGDELRFGGVRLRYREREGAA